MRPRSITGPLILIAIGILFLANNLRPDFSPFALISEYWPFLIIGAGVIGLIEVLFYVGRGGVAPPRPLGGGWIFWILLGAIFAGVLHGHNFRFNSLDGSGVTFLGSDYAYDVPSTGSPQVLSQGVTRLVVDNIRGNLALRGIDSGDIRVSGRRNVRAFSRGNADRANEQSAIHVEREGDAVVVRSTAPRVSGTLQTTADLEITFPKGLSVEARGRYGDLSIDDVNGAVDITSGRGDLRISHIAKDVKIEDSRSGLVNAEDLAGNFDLQGRGTDIQLANVAGEVSIHGDYSGTIEFRAVAKPVRFESSRTEFRVEAVPGTITLDLGNLKLSNVSGPVRFQTGTRDIEATDVTNSLDLTVERGDVHVTESRVPLPKIDVHSHNGNITLSVPDNAAFDLSGTTSRGEVDNEFGPSLQAQSAGRGASIKGQTGGGPRITLATDRGTVSVKKL